MFVETRQQFLSADYFIAQINACNFRRKFMVFRIHFLQALKE